VEPIPHYVHHDASTPLEELFKIPGLLGVTESRNSNSQNDSNNKYSHYDATPIFPTMLFGSKGRESTSQA
jgi:hypothetical protein